MRKILKGLYRKEEGQILIFTGIIMAVLMGFSAITIDVGMMAIEKSKLQNVADAVALAGAQELPDTIKAKKLAMDYAKANGLTESQITITTPFNGDNKKMKVVTNRTVSHTMAKMIGIKETNMKAAAVAETIVGGWAGESLPFVNLDDDYTKDSKIVAWEKTGPGDFESMWPDEYQMHNLGKNDDHSKGYFTINYDDGIQIKEGTVATVKQEVGYIYEQHKPAYIFSLSSAAIPKYAGKNYLKNKDIIPLKDLVLLQVTFDSYDYSGKTLYFTVTGVYDIYNKVFPTEYLNGGANGKSKLIG